MNAEGVAHVFSPELIAATLTIVPVWLGAAWLLIAASALWRRRVAERVGPSVEAVASALGVTPRARWCGWRVDDGSRRVEWSGGLAGLRTRIRVDGRGRWVEGLLDAEAVAEHLGTRAQ